MMNRRLKKASAVLLAMTMLFSLAGCVDQSQGKESSDSGTKTESSADTSSESAESLLKITDPKEKAAVEAAKKKVQELDGEPRIIATSPDSPVLYVEGADLMNGTPIFDIKPYIPYADCHPEATGSFTEYSKDHHLNVEFPQKLLERIPGESREALIAVLADDPRPAYQNDPERSYGMPFGEKDIHFRVEGDILRVYNVTEFVKKQQESSADCGK